VEAFLAGFIAAEEAVLVFLEGGCFSLVLGRLPALAFPAFADTEVLLAVFSGFFFTSFFPFLALLLAALLLGLAFFFGVETAVENIQGAKRLKSMFLGTYQCLALASHLAPNDLTRSLSA
jgi:hypothetical protein